MMIVAKSAIDCACKINLCEPVAYNMTSIHIRVDRYHINGKCKHNTNSHIDHYICLKTM